MKTISEKERMTINYIKALGPLATKLTELKTSHAAPPVAYAKEQVDAFMNAAMPLISMYVSEINETINPLNPLTAPVILAALKIVTKSLSTQFPEASIELSDAMTAAIGVNIIKVSPEAVRAAESEGTE